MTVLEAALAYRELGLSVIPVSTTGKQKKPHSTALLEIYGSSSWKRFRDQPASRDEIRGWYEVAPDAGVAILTGCVSDVIVADFDDRTRVPSFPLTPVATTGRGLHVYLRGQARRRQTLFGDLLGSGTYAVAPPSLHHSGRAYSWQITPPGMGNVFLPEADFVDADEAGHLVFDDVWEDSGRDTYYTREVGLSPTGADASSEEFARQALQQIGVRSTSLKQIRCPFHPDGTPSAGLFRGSTDGGWVFKCQACDTTLTLGQLYAKARGALPSVPRRWPRRPARSPRLALAGQVITGPMIRPCCDPSRARRCPYGVGSGWLVGRTAQREQLRRPAAYSPRALRIEPTCVRSRAGRAAPGQLCSHAKARVVG